MLNKDGEWETLLDEYQEANLRESAANLELLGYVLICQSCKKLPNYTQMRTRYLKNEWTCEDCGTTNSAGKA